MENLRKSLYQQGIITVEDVQRTTTLQLLTMIIEHLNELTIGHYSLEELVDKLLGEGLEDEVAKTLNKWLEDGTLANVVSKVINRQIIIDDINHAQEMINKSTGKVLFKAGTYTLPSDLVLKSNIHIDGCGAVLHMNDHSIVIPEGVHNVTIENIELIGTLKHTKVTELLNRGVKFKAERNVFSVGDVVQCSNYGVSDQPYAQITKIEEDVYTVDQPLSSTGELLNPEFGAVIGTFSWGYAPISGLHNNNNISLINVIVKNARGYSVSLPETDNLVMKNCQIIDNGLDMINLSAENGITRSGLMIENCIFNHSIDFGKQGVHMASIDGSYYENIRIKNNQFIGVSESAISFGYALGHVKNAVIESNTFKNNILFGIHICGEDISILSNCFEGNGGSAIRIADVNGVTYPASANYHNILIKNNMIRNLANGITMTPIGLAGSESRLHPSSVAIVDNHIHTKYMGIETCGKLLTIKGNHVYTESDNGWGNSSLFICGDENSDILIDGNYFDGQIKVRWIKSYNMVIQRNFFNSLNSDKGIELASSDTPNLQFNTNVVITENIFHETSGGMFLSTHDGKDMTRFIHNKLIKKDAGVVVIPFMQGKAYRYEGDGDGRHWISNTDNAWKYPKDYYFECSGKYAYIRSDDGQLEVIDDFTESV